MDILSGDYYYHHSAMEESFEYDAEAIWMAEHCAEYGFILRYPNGKQDVTGIIFERAGISGYAGVVRSRPTSWRTA